MSPKDCRNICVGPGALAKTRISSLGFAARHDKDSATDEVGYYADRDNFDGEGQLTRHIDNRINGKENRQKRDGGAGDGSDPKPKGGVPANLRSTGKRDGEE